MNFLSPDVVPPGNHELDYGLPHLLFLEKMVNFPIHNETAECDHSLEEFIDGRMIYQQ